MSTVRRKRLPPTKAVEAITALHLTGNVIPLRWYRELRTGEKRTVPAHAAIQILADVVYWYRGQEVRDELTGVVVGLRRKFAADRLQVSYSRYVELLGYSRSVVKRAFDLLVKKGLIYREFRTVQTPHGPASNVMFVEPVAAQIDQISKLGETPPPPVYATPSYRGREDPLSVDGGSSSPSTGGRIRRSQETSQETSPETSGSPPFRPPSGGKRSSADGPTASPTPVKRYEKKAERDARLEEHRREVSRQADAMSAASFFSVSEEMRA